MWINTPSKCITISICCWVRVSVLSSPCYHHNRDSWHLLANRPGRCINIVKLRLRSFLGSFWLAIWLSLWLYQGLNNLPAVSQQSYSRLSVVFSCFSIPWPLNLSVISQSLTLALLGSQKKSSCGFSAVLQWSLSCLSISQLSLRCLSISQLFLYLSVSRAWL